jgi:hypothetical protein
VWLTVTNGIARFVHDIGNFFDRSHDVCALRSEMMRNDETHPLHSYVDVYSLATAFDGSFSGEQVNATTNSALNLTPPLVVRICFVYEWHVGIVFEA